MRPAHHETDNQKKKNKQPNEQVEEEERKIKIAIHSTLSLRPTDSKPMRQSDETVGAEKASKKANVKQKPSKKGVCGHG